MRRRDALLLPFLALPATAQTGSAEAGRRALALAAARRWAEADAAAAGADPPIAKVVTWLRLQAPDGAGAAEIVRFGLANPDWPGQDALARRAEATLAADPDDGLAAEWFAARPPRSLDGYGRLADALLRAGRSGPAAEVLRTGWARAPGDALAESDWLERRAAALDADSHWRRFDRLALLRQGAPARLVPLLAPDRRAIAEARLALAADAQGEAGGNAAGRDPGLAYERARALRRQERDAEAAAAFAVGTVPPAALPDDVARTLWAERQLVARRLLRQGDDRAAYATAAGLGQATPGEARQEAEFLAGFIALRRLRDPVAAEAHFGRVGEGTNSVITRARSRYWQGRAAAAAGAGNRAREHFTAAAALPTALYGQLGAIAIGEDGAALSARIGRMPLPAPTAAETAALARSEPAQVAQALATIGEGNRARMFLLRLEELAATPGAKLLVARLAQRMGRPDHAVWVMRRAAIGGLAAPADGWPTPYAPPAGGVEPALIHSVTRQESNFDPNAVSSANARGLMQLLPATAQMVARRIGVPHTTALLTADPAHNQLLGAAYLEELLSRFGGVLPFAAAGYNAGPRRVDEWVATYGDPRSGDLEMLDWMELIPFSETRNYVQRVVEGVAIYRARDPATASLPHPLSAWLRAA